MSAPISVTALAAPELAAVELNGMTRGAFIVRGALAAGAVYGAGTVGPFVAGALAQGGGDVDILDFALTLEHLEADFYEKAINEVMGMTAKTKELASEIGDNEREHVDSLTQAIRELGGKPAPRPKSKFEFSDEEAFLKLAKTIEDTGVYAYNGAGSKIKSKEVLALAGSIVQVEGRHAAAIRLTAGEDVAPDAFDEALGRQQALKKVSPFIES